jgi:hypothetical protein
MELAEGVGIEPNGRVASRAYARRTCRPRKHEKPARTYSGGLRVRWVR